MGAGKTSFGKKLARQLKWNFLDADAEIEKQENRSIPELFKVLGEAGFRGIETDWLSHLDCTNTVISLGGGAPCFNDNIDIIEKKGNSIYLELPPKILVDRLLNSKSERPLIEGFKGDEIGLLAFVENLLSQREKFYQQADIIISGMSMSAERMKALISEIESLKRR